MIGLERHGFGDFLSVNIPIFGLLAILHVVEAKLRAAGRLYDGVQNAVIFAVV
jgi:hypothetical protein